VSNASVHVTAGSRLHFGLFSLGRRFVDGAPAQQRSYGGVGMMVDRPGLQLSIEPAARFAADGPLAERAGKFAARWAEETTDGRLPDCRIHVALAPPEHSGLGVGTQLGLSVAAGLNAFAGRPSAGPRRLAELTARGARSAVGVHGFFHGGVIVEDGKLPGESLSPLAHRCDAPRAWRMVLACPRSAVGLSGSGERQAFRELPPVPLDITRMLRREVDERMLPALEAADFARFSRSVYQFGKAAGECFAPVQGGPYNGALLADIVRAARRLGVEGVGQSSWGPTIFCLLPDESAARDFVARLRDALPQHAIEYTVAAPCNRGALIESRSPRATVS